MEEYGHLSNEINWLSPLYRLWLVDKATITELDSIDINEMFILNAILDQQEHISNIKSKSK